MKILIVEDDDYKRDSVIKLLQENGENLFISHVNSIYGAIQDLIHNDFGYDFIILDMSLPSHSAKPGEGTPISLPTGGLEVIYELLDQSLFNMPIVVLTQYPDIMINNIAWPIDECTDKLKQEFNLKNLTAIYYDDSAADPKWKKSVKMFLESGI